MNKDMNIEAKDCVEEVVEVCELSEELGGRNIGKKIGVGLCVAAMTTAVVVMVRKHKAKLDKIAVKRLTKKGYTIIEPMDEIDSGESVSDKVESKND